MFISVSYMYVYVYCVLLQFHSKLGITDDFPEESAERPLTGSHCVRLITCLPKLSLQSLSQFLGLLLCNELKDLPRGIISTSMKQCRMPSFLEKSLERSVNLLQGLCLANQDNDKYGMVASKCKCNMVHYN